MNTLIVYATKYGSTQKCAAILAEKLAGKVDLIDLKKDKLNDLSSYDQIVIGGSIYMGKIRKEVKNFCTQNMHILNEKKIGLFICCMQDEAAQLNSAFPEELLKKAVAKENFGGELIIEKMGPLDKFITKAVAKTEKDRSRILIENIDRFAGVMNNS